MTVANAATRMEQSRGLAMDATARRGWKKNCSGWGRLSGFRSRTFLTLQSINSRFWLLANLLNSNGDVGDSRFLSRPSRASE